MKRFLFRASVFFIAFAVMVVVFELTIPSNYSDDVILKYQKNKMRAKKYVKGAFFGDSSCGNAVNADLFGDSTFNFALMGDYGYAGSFEMIKLCKKLHPEMQRVVIIQSLDVLRRKTDLSHQVANEPSRLETITRDMYVFGEKLMKGSFRDLLKNKVTIENDYLKQNAKSPVIPMLAKGPMSNNNRKAILDMVKYLKEQKMEYVIVLGPATDIVKNEYYQEALDFFANNNIPFIKDNFHLTEETIGDSNDHVATPFKNTATAFYKSKIDSFFAR